MGIEVREGGKKEEVLVLHYADSAKLFVPLAHVHMVSRYVGVGGKAPSLSKLTETRWKKTRKPARRRASRTSPCACSASRRNGRR
jgi:transcription-repair coupling factor (superfamily II helicase)